MKVRIKSDVVMLYKGKATTAEEIRAELIKDFEGDAEVFIQGLEIKIVEVANKVEFATKSCRTCAYGHRRVDCSDVRCTECACAGCEYYSCISMYSKDYGNHWKER